MKNKLNRLSKQAIQFLVIAILLMLQSCNSEPTSEEILVKKRQLTNIKDRAKKLKEINQQAPIKEQKETIKEQTENIEAQKETIKEQTENIEAQKETIKEQTENIEAQKETIKEQTGNIEAQKETIKEQTGNIEAQVKSLTKEEQVEESIKKARKVIDSQYSPAQQEEADRKLKASDLSIEKVIKIYVLEDMLGLVTDPIRIFASSSPEDPEFKHMIELIQEMIEMYELKLTMKQTTPSNNSQ